MVYKDLNAKQTSRAEDLSVYCRLFTVRGNDTNVVFGPNVFIDH